MIRGRVKKKLPHPPPEKAIATMDSTCHMHVWKATHRTGHRGLTEPVLPGVNLAQSLH